MLPNCYPWFYNYFWVCVAYLNIAVQSSSHSESTWILERLFETWTRTRQIWNPKYQTFHIIRFYSLLNILTPPPNSSFLCSCTCAFAYICIQICVDVHVLLWPVSVIDVRLYFIFTPVKCTFLLKESSLNNSLPLSNPLAILPSFSVQEFIFTWINLHLHKSEKLVLTKSLTSWPESPRQASGRFP